MIVEETRAESLESLETKRNEEISQHLKSKSNIGDELTDNGINFKYDYHPEEKLSLDAIFE